MKLYKTTLEIIDEDTDESVISIRVSHQTSKQTNDLITLALRLISESTQVTPPIEPMSKPPVMAVKKSNRILNRASIERQIKKEIDDI